MKKILFIALVINVLVGCEKDAEKENTNNEGNVFKREQIVGKWQLIRINNNNEGWIHFLWACERGSENFMQFNEDGTINCALST
jgi:hypothetical protein